MQVEQGTTQTAIDKFKKLNKGSLIYLSLTGSCLHGTECETSDVDIKGIFVPSIESLILNECDSHYSDKFVCNGKLHEFKLISIQEFLSKILKMECNAVELLFSMSARKVIVSGPISRYVFEQGQRLLTRNVHSFLGMARAELDRYANKKQRNTHKDIAHGLRSGMQAMEFLDTGKLTYPLPGVNLIKKIKNKEVTPDQAHHLLLLQLDVTANPDEEYTSEQVELRKNIIRSVYGFIGGTI